ncbi:MAG TPA: IS982 family transposase [Gaiellaceae bacterium]|nr:IS982 family transposase [Gaiellaceae bacterium]
MTASLDTLVVAAYVFASTLRIPRSGPAGKVTDHELIALAACQAIVGIPSDRQFLGVVGRLLPGFFPVLPTQTRYNRRLRRLAPYLTTVQLQIAELVATGSIRLIDGTLIGCANYAGCKHVSEFAGYAAYGYCRSKSEWVWGVRLILLSDAAGVPMGYTIAPANEREYEPCFELASAHPGTILFADKGFWGREFERTLSLVDVELVTPDKHRLHERPPAEIAKARIRLIIESVFANLKRQMRLENHLAKTIGGLVQRIAQRLLALTLGIYLNILCGRPPRALAAYDGR